MLIALFLTRRLQRSFMPMLSGCFWENNFKSARDHLAAAIKQSPRDARLWYYKALSEKALGDEAAARHSAENGAALEILDVPTSTRFWPPLSAFKARNGCS